MTNGTDPSKAEMRRVRKFKARYRFGDSPRVFIYCDKHPQRIPVAEFYHQVATGPDGNPWECWAIDSKQAAEQMENMSGDTLIPRTQQTPPDYRLPRRFRYRLTCRICGREVQVREDRLDEILDGLRGAGVSNLSLSGLSGVL